MLGECLFMAGSTVYFAKSQLRGDPQAVQGTLMKHATGVMYTVETQWVPS